MQNSLINVQLTVYCKNMKTPKLQRPKFDQTVEAGSWNLVKHKEANRHENQSVSTTTEWARSFQGRINQKQIIKKTKNLIIRAAEYADILDVDFEITIENKATETFSYHTEKTSDYFKTKSYR